MLDFAYPEPPSTERTTPRKMRPPISCERIARPRSCSHATCIFEIFCAVARARWRSRAHVVGVRVVRDRQEFTMAAFSSSSHTLYAVPGYESLHAARKWSVIDRNWQRLIRGGVVRNRLVCLAGIGQLVGVTQLQHVALHHRVEIVVAECVLPSIEKL